MPESIADWNDCLQREVDDRLELYESENEDAWIRSDASVRLSWQT
ncbi:hypothetical protein ACNS7O_05955 [Haloferacaceae archaeon DSL9]